LSFFVNIEQARMPILPTNEHFGRPLKGDLRRCNKAFIPKYTEQLPFFLN